MSMGSLAVNRKAWEVISISPHVARLLCHPFAYNFAAEAGSEVVLALAWHVSVNARCTFPPVICFIWFPSAENASGVIVFG